MQEQLIEVKLKKPKKEAKGMVAGTAGAVMAAPGQALSGVKGFGKSLQRILTKKRGPEPSPESSVAAPVVDKVRAGCGSRRVGCRGPHRGHGSYIRYRSYFPHGCRTID